MCAAVPFRLFFRPAGQALRSAEAEAVVACKVLGEGFPCGCEFVPDEAHSHQPSPHGELFVFLLLFLGAGAPQVLCHLAHCEAKLNVALELACVEPVLLAVGRRCELEKSELDRAFGEGSVEVEHVIAAVVVVVGSAVFAALCAVPDVRKLCHRGGLFAVELFKESRVNCSAVAAHSALVYSDCLGDQGFVACHKVCEVSEALRCVSLGSNVAVDSTSLRVITARSCLPELSHKLLQGFDVCVVQDRCDQFALFAVGACDADVLLEFPLSALCVPSTVGFVAVAPACVLKAVGAEELGGELCGSLAGDVVHLDLNPDGLLLHSCDLLCGLLSHFRILRLVIP